MGRQRVDLDGKYVVVGYDRPMRSCYAQLYDQGDDPGDDAPLRAVGYHPLERLESERTEHGIYPATPADIANALNDWGLSTVEVDIVCRALDNDLP